MSIAPRKSPLKLWRDYLSTPEHESIRLKEMTGDLMTRATGLDRLTIINFYRKLTVTRYDHKEESTYGYGRVSKGNCY